MSTKQKRPARKKIELHMRLSEEEHAALTDEASRRRWQITQVVRMALEQCGIWTPRKST